MASTAKSKNKVVPLPRPSHNQGTKTRRKNWLKPAPILLLLTAGFIIYSFGLQLIQMQGNLNTMENIEAQIVALEKQNQQLKKEITRLQTKEYIEKEAREKLGLVKPGEKMIIEIVPGKEKTP